MVDYMNVRVVDNANVDTSFLSLVAPASWCSSRASDPSSSSVAGNTRELRYGSASCWYFILDGTAVDVCVVTYRNTADRIQPALSVQDKLWVRDNTHDNIGFGAACNEVAAKGLQPVILFVNPDGDPQPGCFDRLQDTFDDARVVAVSARQVTSTALGQLDRQTWLSGACFAVRRSAFEHVGGFDSGLFMYWEDVDLSWRLSGVGRLAYRHDAVFRHDVGGSRGHLAQFYLVRNRVVMERRWGTPWIEPYPLRRSFGVAAGALRRGRMRSTAMVIGGTVAGHLVRASYADDREGRRIASRRASVLPVPILRLGSSPDRA